MPAKGLDMSTSIFLAKLMGPVFLALGLALLLNGAAYQAMAKEFLASNALIFLAGLLTLTAGLAIVLTHNVWTASWRVLVTLLGWLFIVSGLIRTLAPQRAAALGRSKIDNPIWFKAGAAIWLAVGAILTFYGYFR